MNESGPPVTSGQPELVDRPERWPVVASTPLYRGDWVVSLRSDTLRHPDGGETFDRLVMEDPGAVVILAVDDDDRAVVLTQYRHPVGMRLVELPAGKLDRPGEDPLAAAKRELREEAALAADRWRLLTRILSSPGITEESQTIYLARGLHPVERGVRLDHEEADMEVTWVRVDDLVEAVLAGALSDGPLVVAVLMYQALRAHVTD